MLTVRATYDGKTSKVFPLEPVPPIDHPVPVAIVFLEDGPLTARRTDREWEVARLMRAERSTMEPLGCSVKELVEEGRDR
jgi:hypothetical protein